MLEWRTLTPAEMEQVYWQEMVRDFPKSERKPLEMIQNTNASGAGHTWGVFEKGEMVAYLVMVRPIGSSVSLLDYFAVLPRYRASGLGSRLLAELPTHEEGLDAILIESECPEYAPDPAMAVRRLGFYARCGAVDIGWTEHLFDAWFRILSLPCLGGSALSPDQTAALLAQCYRQIIDPVRWTQFVQFFRPDGTEEKTF